MTDMFGAIYTISCQHSDDVFVLFFSSSCPFRFCHSQSSTSIIHSGFSSLTTSINFSLLFLWAHCMASANLASFERDTTYIMYTTHMCVCLETHIHSPSDFLQLACQPVSSGFFIFNSGCTANMYFTFGTVMM